MQNERLSWSLHNSVSVWVFDTFLTWNTYVRLGTGKASEWRAGRVREDTQAQLILFLFLLGNSKVFLQQKY